MNKKTFSLIILLVSLLIIHCKQTSYVCGTLNKITLNVNYDTIPYGIMSNSTLKPDKIVVPDSTFYISMIINDTIVEYKINDKVYYKLSRKDLKNEYCLSENDILN